MKTNKIIKAIVLAVLSVVMALGAIACGGLGGGGNGGGGGERKFTVTLNADGGTIPGGATSVEVTLNKDYTLPTPTKAGYDFVSWQQGTSVIPTTGKWTIEGNITVKAQWTAKKYTITLDANGGQGLAQTSITNIKKGDYYTLPTNLTKPGFDFAGWTYNNALVDNVAAYNYDSDVTFVAKWVGKTTQVTISANGGQGLVDEVVTVAIGDVLNLPTLTREGYTFAGWKLNEEDFDPSTPWALEDATATIIAQWTANSYTVTIDVNGGNPLTNNTITVKVGEVIALPNVTKDNCQIDKWLVNGNEVDVTAPWAIGEDVTIVAQWINARMEVAFDVNGGEALDSDTAIFAYSEAITLPTTTKVGYNLVGWEYNGKVYVTGDNWDYSAGDITLVAVWEAKTIALTFDVDGGEAISATTFAYGEKPYANVEDIPTTTKQYSVFAGWTYNGKAIDLTAVWMLDVDEVEVKATWTAKTATVSFDANGGVEVEETATFTCGEVVVLPTTTKVGYNLVGWKLGETVYTEESVWAYDDTSATLVAVWEAKTIPVTFNTFGGEAVADTVFTYAEAPYATKDLIPTTAKAGCTFEGWQYNGEAIDLTAVWMLDVDAIELTAVWSGAESTVTIKYGNEDVIKTVVYNANYDFSYERTGYVLVKFVIEGTETEVPVIGDSWTFEGAQTLVAVWEKLKFTLTIKDHDGSIIATGVEVEYGSEVDLAKYINKNDVVYKEVQVPVYETEIDADGKEQIKLDKDGNPIVLRVDKVMKEYSFDGFRIAGTEVKLTSKNFDKFVWEYNSENTEIVLVAAYETESKYI